MLLCEIVDKSGISTQSKIISG